MKKIVIIGSGILGLSIATILRKKYDVKIIPGDEQQFDNGVFKNRKIVFDFFDNINLPYSSSKIKIGLLLRGEIERLYRTLKDIDNDYFERIKIDFYKKTRLVTPPSKFNIKDNMQELGFSWIRSFRLSNVRLCITCPDMLKDILLSKVSDLIVKKTNINRIGCKSIDTDDGLLYYDFLLFTIPIWDVKDYVWWKLDEYLCAKVNLIEIKTDEHKFGMFDQIYVPYSPCNSINKIYQLGGSYFLESSGDFDNNLSNILTDIYFLFDCNWYLKNVHTVNGHFVYPNKKVDVSKWPKNIMPIGKYAEWNCKSSYDVCLKKIKERFI